MGGLTLKDCFQRQLGLDICSEWLLACQGVKTTLCFVQLYSLYRTAGLFQKAFAHLMSLQFRKLKIQFLFQLLDQETRGSGWSHYIFQLVLEKTESPSRIIRWVRLKDSEREKSHGSTVEGTQGKSIWSPSLAGSSWCWFGLFSG